LRVIIGRMDDHRRAHVAEFIASREAGEARRHAVGRIIGEFLADAGSDASAASASHALRTHLRLLHERGLHPNTVRKRLGVLKGYYRWAYSTGHVAAEALVAVEAVAAPRGSTNAARPLPYTDGDLKRLFDALDVRWPRLPDAQASKLAGRWRAGRSPYRRIRRHAVRLQLEAVIALALDLGLRRREVLALNVDDVHHDNAYVVVRNPDARGEVLREVPMTANARDAVAAWLNFRAALGVSHDWPWVALHAGPSIGQPMKPEAFNHMLRVYTGGGWSLKRLRDTCARRWVELGLLADALRELLGIASIEDVSPYLSVKCAPLAAEMARAAQSRKRLSGRAGLVVPDAIAARQPTPEFLPA
jgi:integrase